MMTLIMMILVIDGWGISCEIAPIWMSLDFTGDQSTLVQVMAWCRQATSHYLSQCSPRFCCHMVSLGQNELIDWSPTTVKLKWSWTIWTMSTDISSTLVGNKLVDHSDVVGASPVGTAPTTSSFSTKHLASMDWAKTTARQDKYHWSFGIWHDLY